MTIYHACGSYQVIPSPIAKVLRDLPSNCRIISDHNVWKTFGNLVSSSCQIHVVPPGESSKSLDIYGQGLRWLAQTSSTRSTCVVALGGGVVGDLGGFLAATYMRGVPYMQIPTTLLAQVDSSVGGKVGIDLPEGKNLAGCFYPPSEVHLCLDALQSLPDREVRNGMAEVLKYGFILDPSLLELSNDCKGPALKNPNLERIVLRCIELKALVVQKDERETSGARAVLNFGHTVGHAIENVTGYGSTLHGEAISVGMVVESLIGETLGFTEKGTASSVRESLLQQGLPVRHDALANPDSLLAAMYRDKKAINGKLAFSLVPRLGECKLVSDVEEAVVRKAMELA